MRRGRMAEIRDRVSVAPGRATIYPAWWGFRPLGSGALTLLLSLALPGFALNAQAWNSPQARDLAVRVTEVRQRAQADTSLQSWRTRAHGFVFFLAQVGEGLGQPPKLVKADELDVDVMWRQPGVTKQVILGWRDGRWLPTDINYHRDHLGIVTNNFGDLIRIGDGDEVRDVVHPLSPKGLEAYDFALGDSVRITSPSGDLLLYELRVRPRNLGDPLVVGTLYVVAGSGEVVRFRFGFTAAAYLQPELEDITVQLENARFGGRWWLPYRQEIEIRRRTTWFDFPARGIIRGRWEIGEYSLNPDLPLSLFGGESIAGLRQPSDTGYSWDGRLSDKIGDVAKPVEQQDLDALRGEIARLAGSRVLNHLPPDRFGVQSVSDLVHVNRVQGLTLGLGARLRLAREPLSFRPYAAFGTSDHRFTGGAKVELARGAATWSVEAGRTIRDLSDRPVVSGVLNSLLAQEGGKDFGDYVMIDRAAASFGYHLSTGTVFGFSAGVEDPTSVRVEASPATGSYRPNPSLGTRAYRVARLELERTAVSGRLLSGRAAVDGGEGPSDYLRATLDGAAEIGVGRTSLRFSAFGGWGSDGLPAYRSFVMGGRGTLLGERFREYGGRRMLLGRLEWQIPLPFIAIPLGPYVSTGKSINAGPFLTAGWTDRRIDGTPWRATPGVRPVAGVAIEAFMRLLRVEAGVGLRTGDVGFTVDISPEWWGVL